MADAQEAPNALILEDGEKKSVSMGRGDSPVLFCYPGPRFNVWRSWEDVTFEISGSPFLPKVFGASEDDVHGLLDALLKSYIAGNEESVTDIMTKIEKRAISRTEYIPSLFDLLSECPPIWDSRSTTCTKVFSPFGRSCIALSVPNKSPDGKAEVNVKVKVSFQQTFPAIMLAGLSLMYLARFFSKSKILWYSSGISVSVLLGLVILVVFLCRKVRVPGAGTTGFALMSTFGYGAVWVSSVGTTIKAFALANWELVAGYCGVFALLGMYIIHRIRRNEESKHDFRVMVLWSIRSLGAVLVWRATRSNLLALSLLGVSFLFYLVSRLFGSRDRHAVDSLAPPTSKKRD